MRGFAAILVVGILSGCAGDPLQDIPRLSDTDVSENDIQAAIRAEPEDVTATNAVEPQRGFFGGLFGGGSDSPEGPTPDDDTIREIVIDVDVEDAAPTDPDNVAVVALAEPATPPRGGLLGFLQRAADEAQAENSAGVEVAAAPLVTTPDMPQPTALSGGANGPRLGAPDFRIVPLGTTLPYGTLARVCNVRPRQLGRRVERYPEGRGIYALYDSDPGNTAPHTYYVTGFKDGCARQFTAALALFGSTETHEQLRYGLPAQVQPYSQTDAAYERLKSRVCRVGRNKPCGSALPRLSRNTVFVSVYERFGSNPIWKTILIHDGEVIETDIRGG